MSDPKPHAAHPPIRSFVLRAGRLTEGQRRALEVGWPRYGLDPEDGLLDWDRAFPHSGRRVLEVGFGMGDSLRQMAEADAHTNFVGVEVHRPGVGRLLADALTLKLDNLRVYEADAVAVLGECIAPCSIDGINIFFPDPWHKKRHHKRRLIQPEFIAMAATRLRTGGILHLATDWQPYAEHMLEVMEGESALMNCSAQGGYCERPEYRPETKFERRGARLGHGVWDLLFEKRP
ncbi:tRNA (guanine-N(7)-)-methyltransferase [Luminiphilus syltensis NOR5-1B]|uniref:tRNA (guanine-N(7)-)-methyltransferase n=1 Tax=Luminiphilus syltensis NOR5-1B TaxID=565045 RepID=B8KU84_9GAMM|nr:tRNA (guanosine(46)-N7)-methyltransferase TrmB [Luminiphilus syltensis]EED34505.1 tRNA (guanine-N(7)-)-methyltransferase [Luminiphilus syltensis NOR5-1B]